MLCIICNGNPEKVWPKRWQCWKDNGKFSESLCKLLGLPTSPYKEDFQNSVYCSSCQKRVYNVYLMVRKWDKLQDDINKLKSKLKRDFLQSLQDGERDKNANNSVGNEIGTTPRNKGKWMQSSTNYTFGDDEDIFKFDTALKKENGGNKNRASSGRVEEQDKLTAFKNTNTVVRKRILKRLDRCNLNCDCCDEVPRRKPSTFGNGKSPLCGYPDCQDKECSKLREDIGSRNGASDSEDCDSASSYSGSDWSSHQENQCDDEFCTGCCSSPNASAQAQCVAGENKIENKHNAKRQVKNTVASCSSEYCADCSICNKDTAGKSRRSSGSSKINHSGMGRNVPNEEKFAKRKKEMVSTNKTAICKEESFANIKNEVLSSGGSSEENENFDYLGKEQAMGSPKLTRGKIPKLESDSPEERSPEIDEEGNADNAERFRCYRINCTRTFVSQDDLDIHVKRHHEGIKCPYDCQQCGKAFQWRRELTAHILKHSGEFAICCHLCGRGFRTIPLFNVHLKTKHGGERKYKCSMCDKSFISESKLNTHLTIHTKVYPFACTICGKGFSAKTFLSFHMSKHMEANPYQCSTCSKTFSSPRNLKVHQYTHTQSHPYKCTICQAGTTSETLLKKHMLKHNSEKSNICHICTKTFRFPSSLKKHQKMHSNGEKRFICEFCDKTFIDKYKLTRHLRVHSGDTPFHCTACKESFLTKEYLNKHFSENHEKELESPLSKDTVISSPTCSPEQPKPIPCNHTSPSDDLQLPEINEPLSAYLPDGFPTDPSFLDTLNPADEDLVVTALDLQNFSKEELMMTGEQSNSVHYQHDNATSSALADNLLNHSIVLPDFESFRKRPTNQNQFHNDFLSFTFQ